MVSKIAPLLSEKKSAYVCPFVIDFSSNLMSKLLYNFDKKTKNRRRLNKKKSHKDFEIFRSTLSLAILKQEKRIIYKGLNISDRIKMSLNGLRKGKKCLRQKRDK